MVARRTIPSYPRPHFAGSQLQVRAFGNVPGNFPGSSFLLLSLYFIFLVVFFKLPNFSIFALHFTVLKRACQGGMQVKLTPVCFLRISSSETTVLVTRLFMPFFSIFSHLFVYSVPNTVIKHLIEVTFVCVSIEELRKKNKCMAWLFKQNGVFLCKRLLWLCLGTRKLIFIISLYFWGSEPLFLNIFYINIKNVNV